MALAKLRSDFDRMTSLKAAWIGQKAMKQNPYRQPRASLDPKAAIQGLIAEVLPSRAPHLENMNV